MSGASPALAAVIGVALLEVISLELAPAAAAEPGTPDHHAIQLSVGRIFCTLDGRRHAMGTGFVIDDRGKVMTSRHVVHPDARPCDVLEITFQEGDRRRLRYVGGDPERDLAIVAVEGPTPPPLPLRPAPPKGAPVWALGFPLSASSDLARQWRYTDPVLDLGTVGAYPVEGGVQRLVITDSDAMPGHSGSPVYDRCGGVVGVMRVRVEAGRAVAGSAVPSREIERFLRSQPVEPIRRPTCAAPAASGQSSTAVMLDPVGRAVKGTVPAGAPPVTGGWFGDMVEPWHLAVGALLVFGLLVTQRRRPPTAGTRSPPHAPRAARSADFDTRFVRHDVPPSPLPTTRASIWMVRFVAGPLAGRCAPLDGVFRIGRDPAFSTVALPPDTAGLSKAHAEIRLEGGVPVLRDLDSSAGTRIEGAPVERRRWVPVEEGALVELGGGVSLVLEVT